MKRFQLSVSIHVRGYVSVTADSPEEARQALRAPDVEVSFRSDSDPDVSMLDATGDVDIHDCNEEIPEPQG